jgi:outer membrane protein OmpA-like peptidoglycan-associated protein
MNSALRQLGVAVTVAAVTLTAVTLTAACSPADDDAPAPPATATATATAPEQPAADDVVETREVTIGAGEIAIALHPLVRVDDCLVLTADLTPVTEPEDGTVLTTGWFDLDTTPDVYDGGGAFRLVDPVGLRIHLPAYDADNRPVGTHQSSWISLDADGTRLQRVYAAPTDDAALGVVIPGGYVESLPVIDGEPPAAALPGADAEPEPTDLTTIAAAPVHPLQSFTRQLDGAVQVLTTSTEVTIDLAGDVLFDFGSADLGPQGAAVLDAAAATLAGNDGGVVDIVGHTDDAGDEPFNQTLSEQRAATVAAALADRIDATAFELRPAGKGETEPVVPNDTEENRSQNRRVTLTLTTQEVSRSAVPVTGTLPPCDDGPVATGADGVDLDFGYAGTFHLTASSAQRIGGMLVVTIDATRAGNDPYEPGWAMNLSGTIWSYRGDDAGSGLYPFAPQVLVGSTAVYPFDYRISADGDSPSWRLVGQNDAQVGAAGGQTLRMVAFYPDVAGADTITIENRGLGATFRLTDIPVE